MAGKNIFGSGIEGVMVNQAVSGTTPIVSTPVSLKLIDQASIQLLALDTTGTVVGGTVAGQWLVEGSNNYSLNSADGQPSNAGLWNTILDKGGASPTVTVTGGQKQMYRMGFVEFRHIRVTFTPTAGAGVMQAWFFGKGM